MTTQKTNFVNQTATINFEFSTEKELKTLLVELNAKFTFDSIPADFIKAVDLVNDTAKSGKAYTIAKSRKANTIFSNLVKTTVKDSDILKAFSYSQYTLVLNENSLDYEKTEKYIVLNDLIQTLTDHEKSKQADGKLTKDKKQAIKRYFISKDSENLLNCMIAQATIQNAFEGEKTLEYSVDIIGTYKAYKDKHGAKNPFDSTSNNAKSILCNDLLASFGVTDLKANNNFAKAFYSKIAFINKNHDNQNLNLYGALWQFILASRKQYNNIASKTIDKAHVLKADNK